MYSNAIAVSQLPHSQWAAVLSVWSDWRSRQAQLSSAAIVSLFATVPCLLAMLFDPRTVNGISVWIKPTKFLLSFAVYFGTLAWAFGYLPRAVQFGRAGRFIIGAALMTGLLEMTWIVFAAANGVPSHFNAASAWRIAYLFAGMGSVVLITAILVQGVLIGRQRLVPIAPVLRWSLVAGAVVAFGCTLVVAGYLSAHGGHWVGAQTSDVSGLSIMGWSRTGGDLRVAHFWSLHAQQIIPAIGWILTKTGHPTAKRTIVAIAIGYVALIAFTFVQALQGKPFLAFL